MTNMKHNFELSYLLRWKSSTWLPCNQILLSKYYLVTRFVWQLYFPLHSILYTIWEKSRKLWSKKMELNPYSSRLLEE